MKNVITVDVTQTVQELVNYHTGQAAINAAVSTGGATRTNDWLIEYPPGEFTENLVTQPGIHVRGHGRGITKLVGTIAVNGDGSLADMSVFPPSPATTAITVTFTDVAERLYLNNIYVFVTRSYDGPVICLDVGGPVQAIVHAEDCRFYSQNHNVGGANAKCVLVATAVDSFVNVDVSHCHGKTSSGVTGTASQMFGWCRTSTLASSIYAAGCELFAFYATAPIDLLNENPNYVYAMFDCAVHTWREQTSIETSNVSPEGAYCSQNFQNLYASAYRQYHNGTNYQLAPVISSAVPPTGADDAPEGTIWLVST
jgi:hypothetical protein